MREYVAVPANFTVPDDWSCVQSAYDRAENTPENVAFQKPVDGRWTDVTNREFAEEVGSPVPATELVPLGQLRASGKVLTVWAAEGDLDAAACTSNTFELEWPPRSGRVQEFPEIDRAAWFPVEEARSKLVGSQVPFLDRLLAAVDGR